MALSLTCTCGARLEIDDKFAGQAINCPDCHKQLETRPQTVKPARTSGWAIASLLLALVGAFTVIGPLLAMACGWLSLRQQHRHPELVGGRNYARAGIILGGIFFLAGTAALLSPEVFGVDGLFREIEWAGKLDYPSELPIAKENLTITRASATWGVFRHLGKNATNEQAADDLILIKARADAQVGCMSMTIDFHDRDEEADAHVDRALQRFLSSELVALIGNFRGKTPKLTPEVRDKKKLDTPTGTTIHEMLADLRLNGHPRTFLLRVVKTEHPLRVNVIAAGSRKHRFPRLEAELRTMVESYKISH